MTVEAGGRNFSAVSGVDGRWAIAGVPSGSVRVTIQSQGFQSARRDVYHESGRGTAVDQMLNVGAATESVTVADQTYPLKITPAPPREAQLKQNEPKDTAASVNVGELQRKVVGVLPIAINIPRTGSSYRFVRPLVVDEETKLTFRYRRK